MVYGRLFFKKKKGEINNMKNITSFNKLSKKVQRELNNEKRNDWGALNPVTRKSENKKAYNRKKLKKIMYA